METLSLLPIYFGNRPTLLFFTVPSSLSVGGRLVYCVNRLRLFVFGVLTNPAQSHFPADTRLLLA
jgi:hypothetical protein